LEEGAILKPLHNTQALVMPHYDTWPEVDRKTDGMESTKYRVALEAVLQTSGYVTMIYCGDTLGSKMKAGVFSLTLVG
jgi:ribonucleotide reductase beta subunit family protein with ferritin-like domain